MARIFTLVSIDLGRSPIHDGSLLSLLGCLEGRLLFVNEKNQSISDRSVHRLVRPNSSQLANYLADTFDILELCLPNEYLRRAHILTLVDQRDVVCGGAMVIKQPEFRSLTTVPEDVRAKAIAFIGDLDDVAEVNGVWVQSDCKSLFVSFSFWHQFISELLSMPKKKFLFTYDNSNARMSQLASSLDATVLYSGRTLKLEGMAKPSNETIAMATRPSLETSLELLERRGLGKPSEAESKFIRRIMVSAATPSEAADSQSTIEPFASATQIE